MGTVVPLTDAVWRRVAALEFEGAEPQRVAPPAQPDSCIVLDFAAAVWRRIATLELEVAECRLAIARTPRSSWWHSVYTAELIDAERRLSIAEGMRQR